MDCRICHKKLNKVPEQYGDYCLETCLDDYCYIYDDNYLVTKYKTDNLVFNLLVNTALACLQSPKRDLIYNPKPKYYILTPDEITKVKTELQQLLTKIIIDADIVSKFGKSVYYFLKFTIITNNTNLLPSVLSFDKRKTMFELNTMNSIYEKNLQFDIIHSPQVEKRFKDIPLNYLFHGSSSSNWYSILRNGLKNCSGTSLQANGAAHGNGIYLSDSLTFSASYSRKTHNALSLLIIGVCQIIDKKDKYYKSPNIFVVPNEQDVILRHIIIVNNNSDLIKIEKYFTEHLPLEHSKSCKDIHKINNKRIAKEIEILEKYIKKSKFDRITDIIIDSDNCNKGELEVNLLIGEKVCNLKLLLNDYPMKAPIVYFTNIKIKNINFVNNYLYLNSDIFPKNWSISNKIVNIIEKIIDIIEKEEIILDTSIIANDKVIKDYDSYIHTNKLYVA